MILGFKIDHLRASRVVGTWLLARRPPSDIGRSAGDAVVCQVRSRGRCQATKRILCAARKNARRASNGLTLGLISCFGYVLFLSERHVDIASDWTSETPAEGPARLVITLVSRLVDGAASVLAAEFFSRFRRGYAADPRISAVIPRSRWRNSTVLPSGSSTKMVPIPKSSGSSAEVMSRRRA